MRSDIKEIFVPDNLGGCFFLYITFSSQSAKCLKHALSSLAINPLNRNPILAPFSTCYPQGEGQGQKEIFRSRTLNPRASNSLRHLPKACQLCQCFLFLFLIYFPRFFDPAFLMFNATASSIYNKLAPTHSKVKTYRLSFSDLKMPWIIEFRSE